MPRRRTHQQAPGPAVPTWLHAIPAGEDPRQWRTRVSQYARTHYLDSRPDLWLAIVANSYQAAWDARRRSPIR